MATKSSYTTSCEVVLSPPCAQQTRWIPIRSKGWLQMQCGTPRIERWERPNLVCNALEKTSKGRQKKGMTRHANNQTPTLGPTHDLKRV
jgi:hypothetical protein